MFVEPVNRAVAVSTLLIHYTVSIDDSFVMHLFEIIEEQNFDIVGDPFHYPIIRVLVSLTTQLSISYPSD